MASRQPKGGRRERDICTQTLIDKVGFLVSENSKYLFLLPAAGSCWPLHCVPGKVPILPLPEARLQAPASGDLSAA